MVDASTKKTLQTIPLLQTRASPRDKDLWVQRLKEEYQALIKVCFWMEFESFWRIWFNFGGILWIMLENMTYYASKVTKLQKNQQIP